MGEWRFRLLPITPREESGFCSDACEEAYFADSEARWGDLPEMMEEEIGRRGRVPKGIPREDENEYSRGWPFRRVGVYYLDWPD